MGRLALIDGVALQPADAKISIYDRAFLYGDSVFETIRTYAGELFALNEHIRRLEESAQKIGLDLPVPAEVLESETRRGVEQAGNDESYARVMLTRGSGPVGLDPALATKGRRVVLIEPLVMPPDSYYRDGIGAHCVETVRASDAAHSAKLGGISERPAGKTCDARWCGSSAGYHTAPITCRPRRLPPNRALPQSCSLGVWQLLAETSSPSAGPQPSAGASGRGRQQSMQLCSMLSES